jgi:predicted  nucleic acid-binding Zn-ribbon protein
MRSLSFGDAEEKAIAEQELNAYVSRVVKERWTSISLQSTVTCKQIVAKLWNQNRLDEKLSNAESVEKFSEIRNQFMSLYLKEAKGPSADTVWREWMDDKQFFFTSLWFQAKQEVNALKIKCADLEKQHKSLQSDLQSADQERQKLLLQSASQQNAMNNAVQNAAHQRETLRLEFQSTIQKLEFQVEQFQDKLSMCTKQLEMANQQVAERERQLRAEVQRFEASITAERNKALQLESYRKEQDNLIAQLRSECAKTESALRKAQDDATKYKGPSANEGRLLAEIQMSNAKCERQQDEITSYLNKLSTLQQELSNQRSQLSVEQKTSQDLQSKLWNCEAELKYLNQKAAINSNNSLSSNNANDFDSSSHQSDLFSDSSFSSGSSASSVYSSSSSSPDNDFAFTSRSTPAKGKATAKSPAKPSVNSTSATSSASGSRPGQRIRFEQHPYEENDQVRQSNLEQVGSLENDMGNFVNLSMLPPVQDPSNVSVAELKRWVDRLGIPLPQQNLKKQEWVDLVLKHDRRLGAFVSSESKSNANEVDTDAPSRKRRR